MPKASEPPYLTLVYFPGTSAQSARNSDQLEDLPVFEPLVRAGYAIIHPIYEGTYERGDGTVTPPGGMDHRDKRIHQFKDFARTIDYLETRSDIDKDRIGFYGISWGGGMGAQFPALEPRLKVNIMLHGGLRSEPYEREVDPFYFAPYVKIPSLMLNGKYDIGFPVETSQKPMFNALGTKTKDHQLFETGHHLLDTDFARASLDWLKKYLGEPTPRRQ